MLKYVGKRLLWMIPVILGVAIFIFSILYFVPGDPAAMILGKEATDEEIADLRHIMKLDRPYIVQLGDFLYKTFIKFDFDESYFTGIPVMDELVVRLPRTLILGFSSMILTMLIGIPLGIIAAVHQNGMGDRICMVIALLGVSFPEHHR